MQEEGSKAELGGEIGCIGVEAEEEEEEGVEEDEGAKEEEGPKDEEEWYNLLSKTASPLCVTPLELRSREVKLRIREAPLGESASKRRPLSSMLLLPSTRCVICACVRPSLKSSGNSSTMSKRTPSGPRCTQLRSSTVRLSTDWVCCRRCWIRCRTKRATSGFSSGVEGVEGEFIVSCLSLSWKLRLRTSCVMGVDVGGGEVSILGSLSCLSKLLDRFESVPVLLCRLVLVLLVVKLRELEALLLLGELKRGEESGGVR